MGGGKNDLLKQISKSPLIQLVFFTAVPCLSIQPSLLKKYVIGCYFGIKKAKSCKIKV
jgi:hypothetical protein